MADLPSPAIPLSHNMRGDELSMAQLRIRSWTSSRVPAAHPWRFGWPSISSFLYGADGARFHLSASFFYFAMSAMHHCCDGFVALTMRRPRMSFVSLSTVRNKSICMRASFSCRHSRHTHKIRTTYTEDFRGFFHLVEDTVDLALVSVRFEHFPPI
jgi:hypothetical protein